MTDAELVSWMRIIFIAGLLGLPIVLTVLFIVAKFILGIDHQSLSVKSVWVLRNPATGESRGIIYIDGMPGHPPTPPDAEYRYVAEK